MTKKEITQKTIDLLDKIDLAMESRYCVVGIEEYDRYEELKEDAQELRELIEIAEIDKIVKRDQIINEAKHTPGPWFVNESEDEYDQARNWRQIVTVKNKPGNIEVVPVIKWEVLSDRDGVYGDNAITKEDAHLIAAAPDLLESLEAVLEDCGKLLSEFTRGRAIDAVNKAKGVK